VRSRAQATFTFRVCLCTVCLWCTSLVPAQCRAQCGVVYTVNHWWAPGLHSHCDLVNGEGSATTARSMAFLSNVWMNFLGTKLSSLFTYHYVGRTVGSFLQPEVFMILTWIEGAVYLWHFTLFSCCCFVSVEYRMMKTRGSLSHKAWIYTCENWGRHSRVVEDSSFLRCDAVSLSQWFSTFRRNVVLLSLRINEMTKNYKHRVSVKWGEVKRLYWVKCVYYHRYSFVAVCMLCAKYQMSQYCLLLFDIV
jgi:hypothetical protein